MLSCNACIKKAAYVATSALIVSLGGWKLWSMATSPTSAPPAPAVHHPALEQPPLAQARSLEFQSEQPDTAPGVAKAQSEAVVLTESDPLLLESLKKRPQPTGKQHEGPDKLVLTIAQQLHNEAVDRFIREPGAGFSRMGPIVTIAKREWKTPYWSADELTSKATHITKASTAKDLDLIHRASMKEFIESNTLTPDQRLKLMIRFRPPQKKDLWEIKSLDLIGLVIHDTPVAYVSDRIPEMKNLATKPNRPLDYFELGGLEHLLKGENLFVRSKEGVMRVLGPIRAGSQCMKCHSDVKEGDLLGAFSYTLRPGQYELRGGNRRVGQAAPPPPGVNGEPIP